jgi:CRP/FNR family transcriptional regulator, cyclic AMP receptor protein
MKKYVNILKQADIFYGLTAEQLELVAGICREKVYALGEEILVEGGSSDELYVIAQGEVEILINPGLISGEATPASPVVVGRFWRGQSFGEVTLVDRGLRSASARSSQEDTHLLVLPRDAVVALCEENPKLGYRLMHNLAVDLALKLRLIDLRTREGWLYRRRPE